MTRLILVPDDRPKDLRGKQVAALIWVDATGRVSRVEFDPDIRDRGYRQRLRETLQEYRFRPARGTDGFPVADTTTITLTF
ncbi:MAG: hypothetical protein ACREL3_10090 [Gemmatimonadales bacterium]